MLKISHISKIFLINCILNIFYFQTWLEFLQLFFKIKHLYVLLIFANCQAVIFPS